MGWGLIMSGVLIVQQVLPITGIVSGLAMPVRLVFYPKTSQGIQAIGFQDVVSGSYINVSSPSYSGANLSLTLVDQNGNSVPEVNGLAMSYVAGSNGNWNASFGDYSFKPAIGSGYTLLVDGGDGNGNGIHLEIVAAVESQSTRTFGGSGATESGGVPFQRYALSPTPDGVNNTFTVPVVIGTGFFVENGLVLSAGVDYGFHGNVIVFVVAPMSSDSLAFYQ